MPVVRLLNAGNDLAPVSINEAWWATSSFPRFVLTCHRNGRCLFCFREMLLQIHNGVSAQA
jgi:hypothetical protein